MFWEGLTLNLWTDQFQWWDHFSVHWPSHWHNLYIYVVMFNLFFCVILFPCYTSIENNANHFSGEGFYWVYFAWRIKWVGLATLNFYYLTLVFHGIELLKAIRDAFTQITHIVSWGVFPSFDNDAWCVFTDTELL